MSRRTGFAHDLAGGRIAAPWRGGWCAQAVRGLVFPAALSSAVALVWWALAHGVRAELALLSILLTTIAWVRLAETVVPYDPAAQQPQGKDRRVDGTSLVVMMAVVDPLLKHLWPLLAVALAGLWGAGAKGGIFTGTGTLLVTVPLALLVSGLGEYVLHRLSHTCKPLWGFHALHHSAQRLYWLNGFRTHPVNVAWHQLAGYFVLLLLGVDTPTLTVVSAVAIVVAAFQHANADLAFGPLNYVFSTNELHRWHHDSRPGRSFVNYGSVLSVWDWLLGTYYRNPSQRPAQPGLESASRVGVDAQSYRAQLLAPIRHWGRYPGRIHLED